MTDSIPATQTRQTIWKNRVWNIAKNKYFLGSLSGIALFVSGLVIGNKYGKDSELAKLAEEKEFVYKGDIDGRSVTYQEDVDIVIDGRNRKANVMTVRNGRDSYVLVDYENSNSIDWKLSTAPNYKGDTLERVVISRDDISHTFKIEDVTDATIDGQKAKSLLEKGAKYFNEKRDKIREKKRVEYDNNLKGVEEFLSK